MRLQWASTFRDEAVTDRSGTIAVGGVSQQVCAREPQRAYATIQNISSGDLWLNTTDPAAIDTPGSFRLPPGSVWTEEGNFVTVETINIIGATAGQAYTAKEAIATI